MEELVSFVIPTYNNEATLRRCLEAIQSQDVKKEVIAVDGGSSDKTRDIIEEYNVTLIVEPRRGIGIARNRGVAEASGNFLAFVDADAFLPSGWTVRAIEVLKNAEPDVAGCAGRLMSIEKNAIGRSLDALCFGLSRKTKQTYVNALNTSGVLFRMDAFRSVMFDESFKRGEDTELGFRMRKAGYKLLIDESLHVYHHQPTTLRELVEKWFTYGKSFPMAYRKHRNMKSKDYYARVFFMPIFCMLLIISLIWLPALLLAGIQLLILFLAYVDFALRMPAEKRGIDVLTFSVVHTIKQLSQIVGIWAGLLGRCFSGTK